MKLSTVNRALVAVGIQAELFRGQDYFYFVGPDVENSPRSIVYVPRLTDLSLAEWVEEAQTLKAISARVSEELA